MESCIRILVCFAQFQKVITRFRCFVYVKFYIQWTKVGFNLRTYQSETLAFLQSTYPDMCLVLSALSSRLGDPFARRDLLKHILLLVDELSLICRPHI